MKAIIKKVAKGKHIGQFRFVLKGKNGEVIATSETYTQKKSVKQTLVKCFPAFEIVDLSMKMFPNAKHTDNAMTALLNETQKRLFSKTPTRL